MYLTSVIYLSITVVIGIALAGQESKVMVRHLEPDEGTSGYDLFYYDGDSLRDEKWRFDPRTGSTVVSRRNGFRDKDSFHLVDSTLDALGSFTKSYGLKNEKDFIKQRVKEPQTNNEPDNSMNEALKATTSNAFSGVTFNTEYSTHNGFPHGSNVIGIQQNSNPNMFHSLNFQQAFAGFGFQQLFNQQTQVPSNQNPPNNQPFQLPSFLMPFFNQNNGPNQYPSFGTGPTFVAVDQVMGHGQQNVIPPTVGSTDATEPSTLEPIVSVVTTTTTTTTTTMTTTTTPDPTSNFDIRSETDMNERTNENVTHNIQTTSRRPIEGLPTSDEDYEEGGVLDDKINQQVLKTLVG